MMINPSLHTTCLDLIRQLCNLQDQSFHAQEHSNQSLVDRRS